MRLDICLLVEGPGTRTTEVDGSYPLRKGDPMGLVSTLVKFKFLKGIFNRFMRSRRGGRTTYR